jgi:metalloendopeptidase OMA1, mitochondrial
MKRWLYLILLLGVITGCATYNTATGHNELIFISTSSEVKMGGQINQQLAGKNKIIKGTDEAKRLESIGQRLARISDRQDISYFFYLIESEEMNAFAVPGGHIYFYTGLFRKLGTDGAIAAVLGHEIGHVAAKHTVKKFQGAMGYNVVRSVALNVLAWKMPGVQNVAALGADGLMTLAMSAYGRQDEYEADRLGIKYLYLAGYDLNDMIKMFEVLQATDQKQGTPLILRTHPFLKDRITAAKKEMGAVKEKY